MTYLFVGVGGMIGSIIRYILSTTAEEFGSSNFPYGTLLVNLSGAFLLGWITKKFVNLKKIPPQVLTALTTGVIGSYTTFSTFCLETIRLMQEGDYLFALLYILISLFGGLFFVRIGLKLGESR
ncbi:fluoride efflux transporter CrcB [Neobacillus kokaensis]|uniref:Fluoride-specific ion channel FluC n=1 Tax=Neobacillus kokaensis TaxID=2759023 RepID=A0ABQ3N2M3_9BACI|nr:fluoride efflux transporter CrcB [Neobacillus kokaensis]GHH98356.1 putative fluoride ion transporter CrcB 1 [Neobacillus kokaensis]